MPRQYRRCISDPVSCSVVVCVAILIFGGCTASPTGNAARGATRPSSLAGEYRLDVAALEEVLLQQMGGEDPDDKAEAELSRAMASAGARTRGPSQLVLSEDGRASTWTPRSASWLGRGREDAGSWAVESGGQIIIRMPDSRPRKLVLIRDGLNLKRALDAETWAHYIKVDPR